MGKGSTRRPASVPPAVEADNWARTFGEKKAVEQRCSFSGGPLHGRTQLVEEWVTSLWFGNLPGAPYYRRDVGDPTRFVLDGTIAPLSGAAQ